MEVFNRCVMPSRLEIMNQKEKQFVYQGVVISILL